MQESEQKSGTLGRITKWHNVRHTVSESDLYICVSGGSLSLSRSDPFTVYQVETLRRSVFHDAHYGPVFQSSWHPVGRPRSFQRASELREIVAKIRPDMITRSRCLSPELFPL